MIQINLLPEPRKPSKEIQQFLNPSIAYLIDLSYERTQKARTDEESKIWNRIWAGLLILRKDALELGYSPADEFARQVLLGIVEPEI